MHNTAPKRVRVAAVLLTALALAACGGGGGSSPPVSPPTSPPVSPPPPPPPPPPTSTLTARAISPVTSVQEGQSVKLDASGSADTAGGALSFTWTQTAGPTATIDNAALAKPTITAAEVTADTPATFKVTVTTGALTASATVDISFANIAQTPVFKPTVPVATATFAWPVNGIYGNESSGFVGIPFAPPATSFLGFHLGPSGDLVAETGFYGGNFLPPVTFKEPNSLLSTDPFVLKLAVMSEATNTFEIDRKNTTVGGAPLLGYYQQSIERPCAVNFPDVVDGAAALLIGQRQKGFSVYRFDTAPTTGFSIFLTSVATGQSFCALTAAERPITASGFTTGSQRLPDILAVDVDANVIYHYAPTTSTALTYTLKEQTPVQLNATGTLRLTAQTDIKIGFQAGLAMTFTDGAHNGEHRLVVVGLDAQHNLVQITKSWTLGVPTDVVLDDLDQNGFPEFVVVTSTSPQAVVFESDPSLAGAANMTTLTAPRYFEIGLGATQAIPSKRNVFGLHDLFIAYRDLKQVRVFAAGP